MYTVSVASAPHLTHKLQMHDSPTSFFAQRTPVLSCNRTKHSLERRGPHHGLQHHRRHHPKPHPHPILPPVHRRVGLPVRQECGGPALDNAVHHQGGRRGLPLLQSRVCARFQRPRKGQCPDPMCPRESQREQRQDQQRELFERTARRWRRHHPTSRCLRRTSRSCRARAQTRTWNTMGRCAVSISPAARPCRHAAAPRTSPRFV
mmetsp:Transcript_61095/g.162262  ORF Transcript_61095/g.162262 Transcript_61095/m.162262 type:complete len:205 (+) Transcript_61095:366-980(+)